MTRTLPLVSVTYDVLVIGGGIYGLTIAADAAQRGLSVALVERNDFGSGASFNHLRTIHGGLRYLQTLDISRALESIEERRTLARIAQQYLRPLPFVLPLTSAFIKGPMMMRAGLLLDAVIASGRNSGVPESLRLPAGHVLSADEARRRFPALGASATHGAAVWYDYVTTEADRLTLAWGLAAVRAGAMLSNYADATLLRLDGRRVVGARVVDRLSGTSTDAAARVVVNATGADIDCLLTPGELETRTPMLKAMNLVTRLGVGDAAVGGFTASGRALFMVPWRGRALFGTWESSALSSADQVRPSPLEVAGFLEEIRRAFPALAVDRNDVSLVHCGVVPAVVSGQGAVTLQGRQQVRDHATGANAVDGLISVAGTKYTTARIVAEQITDRVIAKLGRPAVPSRTGVTPLPPAEPWLEVQRERPDLAEPLMDTSPVTAAQIVWAVRHEMAMTLADVVLRRTPLGALGHPGQSALERVATVVANQAGWNAARVSAEIRAVDDFFSAYAALDTTSA